jgi:hypothetical protein
MSFSPPKNVHMDYFILNHIGGVMVSVLPWSVVDHVFKSLSVQTKD